MGICKQMLETKEKNEVNNKEVTVLREEIKLTNKKWEEKYNRMEAKVKTLEKKLENVEKEKRRNNFVITGLEMKESPEPAAQAER